MSARTYASRVAPLSRAAAEAAWTQWTLIGLGHAGERTSKSIVDPEALLLASLALARYERRLEKTMHVWLALGSRLLSLSRLKTLAREQPEAVRSDLRALAAWCAHGDPRWRVLSGQRHADAPRSNVEPPSPNVLGPASLMLRLRLALGVGMKADALTFLLTGFGASIREIAAATAYFPRAVRRAVEELVAAGFVRARSTSPMTYDADWRRWGALLELNEDSVPPWRHWREIYVAIARLEEWAAAADKAGWSEYVAASRLRDLFEGLGPVLGRAHQPVLQTDKAPSEWLGELGVWVEDMVQRIRTFA